MPSRVRLYDPPSPSLYDEDFAAWIEEQVRRLRAGQHSNLDVPNLTEELEALTKRDERALGSPLKRIMARMLKQRYQLQQVSRSWAASIENGGEEIADIIEQTLRRTLPGLMAKNYPRAVSQASRDTRLRQGPLRASHVSYSTRCSGRASASKREACLVLARRFV